MQQARVAARPPEGSGPSAVDTRPAGRPALRPLTVGQIVDGGYRGLRLRPGLLLGTGAVFLVPVAVLGGLAGGGLVGGVLTRGSALGTVVNASGISFAAFAMGLPLARAVDAATAGERMSLPTAFRLPPKVWLAAVVAWALLAVAKLVGSVLVVPAALLVPLGLVVAPVLAVERLGPVAALRRAAGLARRRYARCCGVVALQVVATVCVGGSLLLVPSLVLSGIDDDTVTRWLAPLLQLGVSLVVMPPAALAAALTYLDLRMRVEGLDLEHALDDRLARDAAARPDALAAAQAAGTAG